MKLSYYFSKVLKKSRVPAITMSHIPSSSKVEAGSEVYSSIFGKHSFCGYDCHINTCDIGDFCSIANHVIVGGGQHPVSWVSTSPVFYEGADSVKAKFSEFERPAVERTIIEHDVWIGARAIVKQGVTIGTGAVVGMGSVVTRDVPAYAIVAGTPAKLLRYRFSKELIDRLLSSRWWTWDDEKLAAAARYIRDPEEFLRFVDL